MDNATSTMVGIYGRSNNQRLIKYLDKKYLDGHPNLYKYKVILPKSNGSGKLGETLSSPIVAWPGIGHTQTFISIGSFDSNYEAEACLKYIKTKFVRLLLGTLKATQDNKKDTWANIPLQDFTDNSDIDWSKSIEEIDRQLYKKYELDQTEIDFIEKMIKPME